MKEIKKKHNIQESHIFSGSLHLRINPKQQTQLRNPFLKTLCCVLLFSIYSCRHTLRIRKFRSRFDISPQNGNRDLDPFIFPFVCFGQRQKFGDSLSSQFERNCEVRYLHVINFNVSIFNDSYCFTKLVVSLLFSVVIYLFIYLFIFYFLFGIILRIVHNSFVVVTIIVSFFLRIIVLLLLLSTVFLNAKRKKTKENNHNNNNNNHNNNHNNNNNLFLLEWL